MADTFVIKLQGAKKTQPRKQGDFIRSEIHDAHIYKGQEFPLEELNTLYPKVLDLYQQYREYYLPVPHIVTTRKPDMAKARKALAEINERKKREAAASPKKKVARKRATTSPDP